MFTIPNLLTILRLFLLPPVMILMYREQHTAALIAYGALLLTDKLDGWAARLLNQESNFGEYLDFVIDFVCYYAMIGFFIATGLMAWYNTLLVATATIGLVWITVMLSRKAGGLYMPHRLSSKVLAVALGTGIIGFIINVSFSNELFLAAMLVICCYTLPDYLVFTVRYQKTTGSAS